MSTGADRLPEGTTPPQRAAAGRVVAYFESLSPDSLDQLESIYTPEAWFKDPFNDVRGIDGIRRVFDHMYASLAQPRFVVTGCIVDGDECFLSWNFKFRFKNFDRAALQTVRGGSHLKFSADGRIDSHRDYWDAAEELYEKLPVVGGLMRWLKRRARR